MPDINEDDQDAIKDVLDGDSEHPECASAELEDPEGDDVGVEVDGITSHVLACSATRAQSKSTFKAPYATSQVWTRVAFFDAAGRRLTLSDWHDTGPVAPYGTKIITWTYSRGDAKRAVVLWWMDGSSWHRWASC